MKKLLVWVFMILLAGCQAVPSYAPLSPLAQVQSPLPSLPEGLVYRPLGTVSGPQTRSFLPLAITVGDCGMGPVASQLAKLFLEDTGQERRNIVCDPLLVQAAQYRASDMNARHYFSHIDPDGHNANYWARFFNCHLPGNYQPNGNQIESISLNYPTAQLAWEGWLKSPGHRAHVLGTIPFFREQTRYGIGYLNGDWGIMYVILSSPSC